MRLRAALRATTGNPDTSPLRPAEAQWYAEYQLCKTFGWTHNEYLDTPLDAIQWLTRVHTLAEEIHAEKQAEADRRAGG